MDRAKLLSGLVSLLGGAVVLTALLVFDRVEIKNHSRERQIQAVDQLEVVASSIEHWMNDRLNLVRDLAAFVKVNKEFSTDQFEKFVTDLHEVHRGIKSLQLAPDGIVRYVYPRVGNEAALGHDLRADPTRRDAVERSIKERKLIVAGPVALRQGGVGVIGRLPIFFPAPDIGPGKKRFWGFSIILIDFEYLLMESGILDRAQKDHYAMRGIDGRGSAGETFLGDGALFDTSSLIVDVDLPNGTWQLAATLGENLKGAWPHRKAYWVGGALFAVLTTWLVFFLIRRPEELRIAVNKANIGRHKSEERLQAVVDYFPAAIFFKDAKGRYVRVNKNFEEWYRVNGQDFIGKTPADYFPKKEAEVYAAYDHAVLKEQRVIEKEEFVSYPDGKRRWTKISKFPVLDSAGNSIGLIAINVDETERKEAEAQAVHGSKLAAIGEMAAGMAHELSQPIYAISLTAEEALMDLKAGNPDFEEHEKLIEVISNQCQRMSLIIEHMGAFSRKEDTPDEVFNVPTVVAETIKLMRKIYGIHQIKIVNDIDDDSGATLGHPGYLEQVLVNLINNARDVLINKYADNGDPSRGMIHVKCRRDHGGENVIIIVEDNGSGVPDKIIGNIFDPFFTSKAAKKGTGLGLTVSQNLINAMGGIIEVENLSEGARFKITLPLAENLPPTSRVESWQKAGRSPETRRKAMPPIADRRGEDKATEKQSRQHSILIVDDELSITERLSEIFQRKGYRVTAAKNGNDAFNQYSENPVDLVVTDIRMPKGDGVDLINRLHKIDPALPIIVVTGDKTEELEAVDTKSGGNVIILRKPVDLEKLTETVKHSLKTHLG